MISDPQNHMTLLNTKEKSNRIFFCKLVIMLADLTIKLLPRLCRPKLVAAI